MSPSHRQRAWWLLAWLVFATLLWTRTSAAQQPSVTITCAVCEAGTSVTPPFAIIAASFAPGPLRYTLQIDTDNRFASGRFVVDTTFTTTQTAVSVAPGIALPEGASLFYRATVVDANGASVTSAVAGPFRPPVWVTLVSPQIIPGRPLRTLQPLITWRSPSVNEPPGPWTYTVSIVGAGTQQITPVGTATSFLPGPTALEANASYQLSITARLPRTGQTTIVGPFTFTTEDTTLAVTSTNLYSPFPDPFPYYFGSVLFRDFTCVWFDLRNASPVTLEVLTLRGVPVRTLVPNADQSGTLPAGRYGRGRPGSNESCDPRIQWDGRDAHGNSVPEGVYIIRFRGDGLRASRKVVFRGR